MSRSPFGPAADYQFPDDGNERLIAAVDLIGRTGAREYQGGYLHDDVPIAEAGWWAHAEYGGQRVIVDNEADPIDATEKLALKLLNGGKCACGKVASSDPAGIMAYDQTMADGTTWTKEQQAAAGVCTWRRVGPRWVQGCGKRGPFREDVIR